MSERTMTLSGVPTELVVNDKVRDAAIAGLVASYNGATSGERRALAAGIHAGILLVVAGASAAEAVLRK